jgi:hypothetical protein
MRTLLSIILLASFSINAWARSFEIQIGSGSNFTKKNAYSDVPDQTTVTETKETGMGTVDLRLMIYPLSNNYFAVGFQFPGVVQSPQTVTSTDPNLAGYDKMMSFCTSSEVVAALDLYNSESKSEVTQSRFRLLGGTSIKGNCSLNYQGAGKETVKNTGKGTSSSVSVDYTSILWDTLEFGVEFGYRQVKSGDLADPSAATLVNSTGEPVHLNMSSSYLQFRIGLMF